MTVFAYDVNDTLRINAEYRESGVLTESTANITIFLPNGLTSVYTNMTNISTGLFHYDYTIPNTEGEYTARIDYYKLGVYTANESQSFDVGDVNLLKWGVCPDTSRSRTTLFIIIAILLIMGIIGILIKMVGLTFFSGILFLLMYLIVGRCEDLFWIVTTFLGLIFLMISASIKT